MNGLLVGDRVVVAARDHQAGLGIVNARVSASNTIAISWMNCTGGSITPTTEVYDVLLIRPDRIFTDANV